MQPHQPQHRLPNASALAMLNIEELMQTTLRLSDVLAQETTMLTEMRFADLARVNEEKTKLTKTLELYQQRIATDPGFLKSADPKMREELVLLSDDLAFSVEENFRHTAVARAVNERVMQAIMDVVGEKQRPGTYGPKGRATQHTDLALSLNLNQKA